MKNNLRLTLGGVIICGAAFFTTTQPATSYSTIGGALNLGQRDFRVYDNFNGSSANNNNAADDNWPGFTGAELAIWKGGAEWNSRAHGDGSGDSSQGVIGSGGANFTFFFEGMANGIGGGNDNIVSSLGGSSGGVLAYCETPIQDGWRIRFYGDAWTWQDGPGGVGSGVDIQGVACHELGHALGLGHSTAGGSPTINAYISGTGQGQRSLATDDSNGVQYIYGSRSNTMPFIDSVSKNGNTLTITGGNFSASANRVWLMNSVVNGANSGGDHLTIENVPSSNNGTVLTAQLPASGWELGNIAVKRTTGGNFGDLSETHPFDGSGGGGGQYDNVTLTVTDTTPNTGQGLTFTCTNTPLSSPYRIVWSNTDRSPFFGTFNGLVGTGTTTQFGGSAYYAVVPNAAAGRTVYLEAQFNNAGVITDSNTIRLDIN